MLPWFPVQLCLPETPRIVVFCRPSVSHRSSVEKREINKEKKREKEKRLFDDRKKDCESLHSADLLLKATCKQYFKKGLICSFSFLTSKIE